MSHKHYKALGNYPETAILLLVIFTETTIYIHGNIEHWWKYKMEYAIDYTFVRETQAPILYAETVFE